MYREQNEKVLNKMKNKLLIITLLLPFLSVSQNENNPPFHDSATFFSRDFVIEKDNPFVAKLDSLLLFYERMDEKFTTDTNVLNLHNEDPNTTPVFHDSIIKKRLKVLDDNTPFELNYNKISRAYINMYIKRRKSMSIFLARKETYFPIFEEMLLKYKLPMEFKYLPIVESALKPNAESWAGAAGLWQFMYTTGTRYGLVADSYMDLRKDPYKSTEGACKHLTRLYKVYGNWELVLAAYNSGGGNVNKAIRKAGGKRDFWEIYKFLPKETQGYVPAFIGINYAMNYASEHNIYPMKPLAKFLDIDTTFVNKRIDLRVVSRFLDVKFEHLSFINPAYIHGIIPKRENAQYIYLPKEKMGVFYANEEAIYAASKELKKIYNIPEYYAYKGKGKRIKYRVKSGDYLGKIAKKYGVKVRSIKKWNNLRGVDLRTGQLLYIYSSKKEKKTKKEESKSVKAPILKEGESYTLYIIKKGDNLWDIAKKFPGVSVEDISIHNNGLSSRNLKTGKTIKIINRG